MAILLGGTEAGSSGERDANREGKRQGGGAVWDALGVVMAGAGLRPQGSDTSGSEEEPVGGDGERWAWD